MMHVLYYDIFHGPHEHVYGMDKPRIMIWDSNLLQRFVTLTGQEVCMFLGGLCTKDELTKVIFCHF